MHDDGTLRIGLVGCGAIAQKHLRYWGGLRRALVAAVCDIDESAARETARTWRVPRYYGDMGEMVRGEGLSAVDICTPPVAHYPLIVQAAEAGCHVLVEKPLVQEASEAEKLLELHRGLGTNICTIHNNIFDPAMRRALSIVGAGGLGEIRNIDVRMLVSSDDPTQRNRDHWRHSSPGGALADIAVHAVYILQDLLGPGLDLASVRGLKAGTYPWVHYDELSIQVRSGSAFGSVYCSLNSARDACSIDIYGTRGILKIDLVNQTLVKMRQRTINTLSRGLDGVGQSLQLARCVASNGLSRILGRWTTGHEVIMDGFVDSVLDGTKPPVPIEDACACVRLLDRIRSSIDGEEARQDA